MKKSLVLLFVMLAVLVLANAAFAAERYVISVKVGVNATGAEAEKINSNGTGLYIAETTYRAKHTDWGWYDWGYVTLFGVRKHAKVEGTHSYLGAAIGVTDYIWPTVDGHIGMEFHPSFLPDFLNARAEAGASAVFGWAGSAFRPVIHFGAGVSYDFDWNLFNDLF